MDLIMLDSIFYQLLHLRAEDFQGINEIQNKLLSILSLQVIHEITSQTQSAPYFTVMIDQATDLANIEQVVLVIHSVNDNFTVTEDFIALYKTESTESSSLVRLSKMSCFG